MTQNFIKYALWYASKGLSVIPVMESGENVKKPRVKWVEYQKRKSTVEEITEWWTRWPGSMIGLVTGAVSGVVVVDVDVKDGLGNAGHEALEPYLPESLTTPIASTPSGGRHIYFQHPGQEVGNHARRLPGVDFRGDGGYIVAPPSQCNGAGYAWLPGLQMGKVGLAPLPERFLREVVLSLSSSYNNNIVNTNRGEVTNRNNESQLVTLQFTKGHRDDALFHVANCLVKGGMERGNAGKVLEILAKNCSPPFPEAEVQIKLASALDRVASKIRNVAYEVREFVESQTGHFSVTDLSVQSQLVTKQDRHAAVVELGRLAKEGVIERYGSKSGVYRKVETQLEPLDFMAVDTAPFDVRWPFAIERMVKLHPKSLVVVAGEANAGKTAFLLNVVRLNQNRGRTIRYFSSEMGNIELKERLQNFDEMGLSEWNFQPFERSGEFADVVDPDGINIVDYLEMSDNFFRVGGDLKAIFDKLKSGIAIIAIQKDKKSDLGRGGAFGLEKPRLYLSLADNAPNGAVMTIRKAKNWMDKGKNPNGLQNTFRIVGGANLYEVSGWVRPLKGA